MAITVYWACNEKEWLRAKEPESIYKNFIKNIKNKKTDIAICPSIKEEMQNIFSLKSLYDYSFKIDEKINAAWSELYDQEFYDKHVQIRSIEDSLCSFQQEFIFFTEEKKLEMSAGMTPYLENNNIIEKCILIPGIFDIGKWFRPLDFAFYLKNNGKDFKIEENEVFQYIRFHSNKKIIFKQFIMNEKLNNFSKSFVRSKSFRKGKMRSMDDYYLMAKHKKNIIKEIKKNLVKGK